MAFIKSIDE